MTSRNHEAKVRYSKEEFEKVKRKCENAGLSISQFLRLLSLQSNVEIEK